MFVIKDRHLEAFRLMAGGAFEDQIIAHLRGRFPQQCQDLDDETLRGRVQQYMERAEQYEIRTERDVSRFICFQFSLGHDFDKSRAFAWAREILSDTEQSAAERLDGIPAGARERGIRRQA